LEPEAPEVPPTKKPVITGGVAVEEGPVALTDSAKVTVEIADDASGPRDPKTINEDAPPKAHVQYQHALSPEPAGPPREQSRPARRKPDRQQADARDVSTQKGKRTRGRQSAAVTTPTDRIRPPDEAPQALTSPKKETQKRRRHLLLFALVPLLVIATFAFRHWQQRRGEFPLIVERGRTDGIPALEEGDFDKANQLLSAARKAVDALGGADEEADAIRHAADEAAIFVDLIARPLEDLLAEAGRMSPDAWASQFKLLYKGRAILIDSEIVAAPEPGGKGQYEIQYTILPPGEQASFRPGADARPDRIGVFDFTGFQLFELAQPRAGTRVPFGARLASFEYDGLRNCWIVRLEPKSGVFIKHTKALLSLGWPSATEMDTVGQAFQPAAK
jgi:hypothetical protein